MSTRHGNYDENGTTMGLKHRAKCSLDREVTNRPLNVLSEGTRRVNIASIATLPANHLFQVGAHIEITIPIQGQSHDTPMSIQLTGESEVSSV